MSRSRKSVRARVRAELNNFQLELDPRATRYEDAENRYEKMLLMKKKEKRLRNERKRAVLHIGQKNLRNRWEALSDADYYG